jgi:TonB family protein
VQLDLEDYRPEPPAIETAISLREGVILSIAAHAVVLLAILFIPKLPFMQAMEAARQQRLAEQAQLLTQQEKDSARFVYVAPKIDLQAKKPPQRAEMSDLDRTAQSLQKAPNPKNPLPFSLGNTSDRTEAQKQAREKPRGQGPNPEPSLSQQTQQAANTQNSQQQPSANTAPLPFTNNGQVAYSNKPPAQQDPNKNQASAAPGGSLGQALKNLEKYTDSQTFNNPDGNAGQVGPSIQFDTKGVEFGPWLRRFIAQVKRNWFIPMAAMSLKGHVVLQFRIHKSGAISDLVVVQPSNIEAFTNAAVNAIRGSNPTQPLPPEYPDENSLFTVTFYYNETPP